MVAWAGLYREGKNDDISTVLKLSAQISSVGNNAFFNKNCELCRKQVSNDVAAAFHHRRVLRLFVYHAEKRNYPYDGSFVHSIMTKESG